MAESSTGGFNFGDLLGGGKGLEVLADLIKSFSGAVSNSYFIRKDASAKADALRLIGQAEAEVSERKALAEANSLRILAEGVRDAAPGTGGITVGESGSTITSLPASPDNQLSNVSIAQLIGRAERREVYQNVARQQNLESVTAIAAEQLAKEEEISNEPVNPDWATHFFRDVEDVSSERMQAIWGRILAGEIKKPNSYSIRTLEVLKSLSPSEAEIFMKYAKQAMRDSRGFYFLFQWPGEVDVYDQAILREAGLMSSVESLIHDAPNYSSEPDEKSVEYFGYGLYTTVNPGTAPMPLQVINLTTAGAQIIKLITPEADLHFLSGIVKKIRGTGRMSRVGEIVERDERGVAKSARVIDM